MPLRLFSNASAIVACGIASLLIAASCGGDDAATADSGPPRVARLVIQPPPDDTIGLAFNGTVTLRVLYETDAGEPIADGVVQFAILAVSVGEDPGGSTLSANQAITDAQGIARVDLHAGAERTHYRVEASAPDAPSARYYVSVSEGGFARLMVTPVHEGWRDPESFERIELRLYHAEVLRCADVDIDDLPSPVLPPRSLAEFGGTATYQSISSGEPYTLVGWTLIPESTTRMSLGCMDIGGQQLPPGNVSLSLVVRDRSLVLPSSLALSSTFDPHLVAEAAGGDRPWAVLACPVGPGQLLLDCTLDAMAPDALLDCVVESEAPVVAQVEAHRGEADGDGCRPALVLTDPSLDQQLVVGIAAGATWPLGTDLESMLGARVDSLSTFELASTLTFLGPASARHRITHATVDVGGTPFEIDLGASSRPVLQQSQVPIDMSDQPHLVIGGHGFTLHYGSVAHAAFVALGLTPHGLDDRAHDLGTALVDSVFDLSAGAPGCASVSAIICAAIGAPLDCAQEACGVATVHLDTELTEWWKGLDGAGIDLTLAGNAPLYDSDDNLYVDAIGRSDQPEPTGLWSAVFTLSSGEEVTTIGAFGSPPEAEPE